MSMLALALVLGAAIIHASWNLLAKRVAARGFGGPGFVFLAACVTSVGYLPVVAYVLHDSGASMGTREILVIVVSAILHMAYTLSLQKAYELVDISVVYPVTRGIGPLAAIAFAMTFLGERLSPLGYMGAALITGAVFIFAKGEKLFMRGAPGGAAKSTLVGVGMGVLTGAFLASYTVWDGYAVKVLLIAPIVVDYFGNLLRAVFLAPAVLPREGRLNLRAIWREHRTETCVVGTIAPLSYILILCAMQLAPVSSIAPARELSMMVVAYIGMRFMGEGEVLRRSVASGLMVAGVTAMAYRG